MAAPFTVLIMAAGQGTRMRSDVPKVLHRVAGKTLVEWVVDAALEAGAERVVAVVRPGDGVAEGLPDGVEVAEQTEGEGTGSAVLAARELVDGGAVVVLSGDQPLITADQLEGLLAEHEKEGAVATLLTTDRLDPAGFGRIVRKDDGTVEVIVEEYVATPEQQTIKELNVGAYCFKADWLWDALHRIEKNPKKGEYYLTDIVEVAVRGAMPVQAVVHDDFTETIGINTRVHLSEAEAALRMRINREHMLNGVSMMDPASTYIDVHVKIGKDTAILPNTYIHGNTEIGAGNTIGPNTIIRDSKIGNRCRVLASALEGAILEDEVDMGPFARLRKGAHLKSHVHMGNFGEVKDSTLHEGVKMGHFSYIGNATVGAHTNIGAGTITANYDGEKKNPTEIGEDVFIGSDTMLVAPLKVGDGARTGAGAVVTKNVPDDTLVVGMPARAIRKLEKKAKKENR